MPNPNPGRSYTLQAEPVLIAADGTRSDAALHADMLDNNPEADAYFAATVIEDAVAGGMSREDALRFYGPQG